MNNIKLPVQCPACESKLTVSKLSCQTCNTEVSGSFALPLFLSLPKNDQEFMLEFFLSSGSLKDMATKMGVSYPTVRNQLDDIIQKINTSKNNQ